VQREVMEGVPVIRVALYPDHSQSAFKRILNYASFALSASVLGPFLVAPADVMYVLHPPATVGLPAIILGLFRRIPFVYDIQDLWPDTLAATGMVRRGWMLKLAGAWCRMVYRRAGRIVVLSPGLKQLLSERKVPPARIEVIPNWCDEEPLLKGKEDLEPEERSLLEGRFNVVFAGNMGKVQGLETILGAAGLVRHRHPQVQFVLVGRGVEVDQLKAQVHSEGLDNVLFLPRRPIGEMGPVLRAADGLLVHLKKDPLFEITIPSKIQAYLAVGRPILVGVHGDARAMVEEARAGLGFEPEDPESLASALGRLVAMPEGERKRMGANGKRFYGQNLSLQVGTEHFLELFRAIAS
jgi:glycosyltransferase involved in cell wall biosynthesis